MTHPLVELSRTRANAGSSIIIEDYDKKPVICRSGVWVGLEQDFTETVLLSYEHDPEVLYVGWSLNGTTVVDPGYGSGTPPWGAPVPGAPSCVYRTPVDGHFHELSITSAAGSSDVCVLVQVLYRHPTEAGAPAHLGPSATTCLSGSEVTWPEEKLEESEECFRHFLLRLYSLLQLAVVGPGDPVERWLVSIQGQEVIRLVAEVALLESIDHGRDAVLAQEVRKDLMAQIEWAGMPGSRLRAGAALPWGTPGQG